MRSGMNYFKDIDRGNIFLVPFPFSDFSELKVRPVLILSDRVYNCFSDDIIICAITRSGRNFSKYCVPICRADLVKGKVL